MQRRIKPLRAVIYVNGTDQQRGEQLQRCNETCDRRRYAVSGVARDDGRTTEGWVDAQLLRRSGAVDRIVVASRRVVPQVEYLESATGEIPREPVTPPAASPRHRRPRRLR